MDCKIKDALKMEVKLKMRRANSTGSVIKLSGKRRKPYAVRVTAGWTDDGKQVYKYLSYHEKKTDAKRALDAYNVNPYDLDAMNITFAEVYIKWSEKAYKELAKGTADSYRAAYKHASRLYDARFRDLRVIHLQDTVDAVESESMKKVTKFLFQKMSRYAMENDIIEKDYSKFVKAERKKAKEKMPLTEADIQALWDNLGKVEYVDLTLVLVYTGMRIGELIDMKKDNVNLEERYMTGGNKTEAGKNRLIPLHPRIIPIIKARMEQSESEYLFTNEKGQHINYRSFVTNQWKRVAALFENGGTPHVTRHSFVSMLDSMGVNKVTIQRLVGHSNKEVTDIYIHKSLDELRAAVDLLE